MAFEERDVPRRRRRPLVALIVTLLVLGVLAVVAVAADHGVRAYAEDRVREQLRPALGLAEDAPLDVHIDGFPVLAQLAAGRIDSVRMSADEVSFGGLTGPVSAVARGVPLDSSLPVEGLGIRFAASEASLSSVSTNFSELPITSVAIDGDEIDVAAEFTALFVTLPLGVGLEPSVVDGQIAFTPTRIRLAEAEFTADDLVDRFGSVAEQALRTQNLCIAQYLPAAFVLERVRLTDRSMVLTFDGSGAVLDEATLSTTGTC